MVKKENAPGIFTQGAFICLSNAIRNESDQSVFGTSPDSLFCGFSAEAKLAVSAGFGVAVDVGFDAGFGAAGSGFFSAAGAGVGAAVGFSAGLFAVDEAAGFGVAGLFAD